eukprot:TRINITY_DN64651_c0_g1_i1.p2 TRINITY_DN64651_c0_g1~~TRINITY_DN64651_c0_g1_i1.p2  ORF type:complete len:342 (-),score=72.01 TRINITY_DN64651_c0_g1_i1:149-1174(-)
MAAATAAASLTGARGTLGAATGGRTGTLGKSVSQPTLLPSASTAPVGLHPRRVGYYTLSEYTVSERSLMDFLFPASLENPNSCARLELYAKCGPTDEEGNLRGGMGGSHVCTNGEVHTMAHDEMREAMFQCFKKPRSDVEVIVDSLLPSALARRYSPEEVWELLRSVPRDVHGRMCFADIQRTVLESRRLRLRAIVERVEAGKPIVPPKERLPKLGYQSKSAHILTEVMRKKKFTNDQEQSVAHGKKMHAYNSLIAPLEMQNMNKELRANANIVRHPGDVNDKWDRYCALRRVGRSSYVGARNAGRFNASMDEGLANKHPGTSSLLAASAEGSSAACALAA